MVGRAAIRTGIAAAGIAVAVSVAGLPGAHATDGAVGHLEGRTAVSKSAKTSATVTLSKRRGKLVLRVTTRGTKVLTRWKVRSKKATHHRSLTPRHGVAKTRLPGKATRIRVRIKSHGAYLSKWATITPTPGGSATVIPTSKPKPGNNSGSDPGNSTSEFPWTNSDQIYIKTENSGMVWENKTSFSAAPFSCSGFGIVPLGTVGTVDWGPKSWVGRKAMLIEVWEERSNTSYSASLGGFNYHSSWWQFLDENFKTPSIAEHPTWSGWVKPLTPDTIEGRKIMPLSYTGGTRF